MHTQPNLFEPFFFRNDRFRVEPSGDGLSLAINGGDVGIKLMNMGEDIGDHSAANRPPMFAITWELQDEVVAGAILQAVRGA